MSSETHITRPRIYLAGPEVFLPDSLDIGAKKVALCAAHGFEGVFPLDASLDLTGLAMRIDARSAVLDARAIRGRALDGVAGDGMLDEEGFRLGRQRLRRLHERRHRRQSARPSLREACAQAR